MTSQQQLVSIPNAATKLRVGLPALIDVMESEAMPVALELDGRKFISMETLARLRSWFRNDRKPEVATR